MEQGKATGPFRRPSPGLVFAESYSSCFQEPTECISFILAI